MYRLQQQYAGKLNFRFIDVERADEEDWQLLDRFFDNSVPTFGFFDKEGTLVDHMTGWDEEEFERRVLALAGAH